MTWLAIGSVATTVGGAVLGGMSKKKQVTAQNAANFQQEGLAWEQNLNDNKAIQEANLQNMIRTGYKAGILNVQRGQAKQEAAEAGLTVGKNTLALMGSANANSFAAGQLGSSVDSVATDIMQKSEEAKNGVDEQYLLAEANFDVQMHDLLTAGLDAQRSSRKGIVQQAANTSTSGILGEALIGAAVQVGGSYMSANMSLGLGTKSMPTGGIGKPVII